MQRSSTFVLLGILPLLSLNAFGFDSLTRIDPFVDAADRQQPSAPVILQSLGSPNAALRTRAAETLGRILRPESVDPLLALLKDSDTRVVREALFSLGQLGWNKDFNGGREKEMAGLIVPFLSNSSDMIRAEAAHAIGKLALDETPVLLEKLLADSSPRVREEALIALFRYRYSMSMRGLKFTPWSDDFSSKVLALGKDSDLGVKRALAFIYSRYTDARALSVETAFSTDLDATVRVHAFIALKRLNDIRLLSLFLGGLKDPSKEVRYAAIDGIDGLKAYDSLTQETLDGLSHDPYHAVRMKAASLLGKSTDAKNRALYTRTIARFLRDKSLAVGSSALTSLIQLLRSGTPTAEESAIVQRMLTVYFRSKAWQYRLAAVQSYVSIMNEMKDGVEATPLQKQAMLAVSKSAKTDSHLLVRTAAIHKMVTLKGQAGWEMIEYVLRSESFSERSEGLSILPDRAEPETDKVALLMSHYQASLGPKYNDPRAWTVEVLSEMQSQAATDALKATLSDSSPVVVAAATKELKKRGVNVPEAAPVPLTFTPFRDLTFRRNPLLIFYTVRGKIVIEGLAQHAPIHVANFVGQARAGFYNGKTFQRVVPNFVVQGGADDMNGYSSDAIQLRAEMNRVRYTRGAIGSPRSSAFDSGISQLFINQITSPWLDGLYTIFARVVSGMDVVDRMEVADEILKVEVRL